MAVNLSPVWGVAGQLFDNNGNILAGGKIFTYAAGTNTNQATYTSAAGSIAHSNPIILDAAGRVPSGEIWLTDGLSYKFVVKDAQDNLIGTYDNLVGINSNFVNYTNSQELQTATAGQTVFTLTTMTYQPGTHSLSVFVDGVNQYGPGAQYAYTETSSTVVTFVSGLHVGAEVKFTTSQINGSSYGDASQIAFTGFKGQIGNVQDLAGNDGSDWIGFEQAGTGAVACSAQDKMRQIVSVKDFGAVGDGVTDDSAAIQALADYLSNNNGAYVIWPEGTYYVARTGAPETVNFEFQNCGSMTWEFVGGANISFKADFVHSASLVSSKIVFRNCQNLTLINVETNGNVSTGTKVGAEQGEHGLSFVGCKGVTLINPKLHDHPNDGLYIDHIYSGGAISVASERFYVNNLDTYNNGRQGMSVIGLFGAVFDNCTFRDTGNTGGFGFYSPGAGIDIEPNVTSEICVQNVVFNNPKVFGNIGSIFACINLASPSYPSISDTGNVDDIHFNNPNFETSSTASGTDQIIFAVKNGSINGGQTVLTNGGATNPRITPIYSNLLSGVQIRNHVVYGKNQSLLAVKDATRSTLQQTVTITNCKFICQNNATNGGALFLQVDAGGEFSGNYVYTPSAAYSTGSATRELVRLRKLDSVNGNIYETNMTTPSQQFQVDYTDSVLVANETFKNPTYFWAKNDAVSAQAALYGRGQFTPGMQLNLYDYQGTASGNLVSRIFSSYVIPSSGTWQQGDIVFNSQPSAGGDIGWVCTSSGTPGTWKTFGAIAP